jgi:hypothetical protein
MSEIAEEATERSCGEASTREASSSVPVRRTVLLVGPTGAGKSATANAFLSLPGRFVSRRHVAGVTQQPAMATSTHPPTSPPAPPPSHSLLEDSPRIRNPSLSPPQRVVGPAENPNPCLAVLSLD